MKNRKDLKQVVRFGIIGVLNTLIDFGIFYVLVAAVRLDKSVAQVISTAVAMTNSYLMNRYFTFLQKGSVRLSEMIKFVTVNLVSMGMSVLCLYVFCDILNIGIFANRLIQNMGLSFTLNDANVKLLAKILGTPFVLAVNFIGNKFWVFNN